MRESEGLSSVEDRLAMDARTMAKKASTRIDAAVRLRRANMLKRASREYVEVSRTFVRGKVVMVFVGDG